VVTSVARGPRLVVVASLLVVWLGALTILVLTTSNPVVLNRAQLRTAPLVIMARVTDLSSGRCDVERQWGSPTNATSVTILGLQHLGARTGERYLFALQRDGSDAYEIVPAGKEHSSRPIYPATPESIAQLEQLLGESP